VVAPHVDGKFASAFVRARKPGRDPHSHMRMSLPQTAVRVVVPRATSKGA